jgi:mycofactocin precursor
MMGRNGFPRSAAAADPEVIPMTDHDGTEVTDTADDVEESEELLIEEISIDGMCGVY